MKNVKIHTITKKQAKSYMVLAVRNLKASPNEISEQELWDEMETVMSMYQPYQAVEMVADTIKDNYRVK